MSPLRDLLEQACAERDVADCEFFINKRDYPQLKFNPDTLLPVEPYGFIYDKDDRSVCGRGRDRDDATARFQQPLAHEI